MCCDQEYSVCHLQNQLLWVSESPCLVTFNNLMCWHSSPILGFFLAWIEERSIFIAYRSVCTHVITYKCTFHWSKSSWLCVPIDDAHESHACSWCSVTVVYSLYSCTMTVGCKWTLCGCCFGRTVQLVAGWLITVDFEDVSFIMSCCWNLIISTRDNQCFLVYNMYMCIFRPQKWVWWVNEEHA